MADNIASQLNRMKKTAVLKRVADLDERFTLLGWQGIVAEVPENWNLAAVSGDRASGYFRADSPDRPRFEVKWWKPSQAVHLQKVLERYIKEMRKKSRRHRKNVEAQIGIRLVSRRRMKKPEMLGFAWRGEECGCGLIWRCGECDRVVMAQVIGTPEENLTNLADRIIGSVQDHSPDGWDLWCAYGFLFRVPNDFALDSFHLVTGKLEFKFIRGDEFISVCRWAMADVLLKGGNLTSWLNTSYLSRLKNMGVEISTARVKSHAGALLVGKPRSLRAKMQERIGAALRRRSVARIVGHVWHCEKSNKIFAAECRVRLGNDDLLPAVTDSINCHEE